MRSRPGLLGEDARGNGDHEDAGAPRDNRGRGGTAAMWVPAMLMTTPPKAARFATKNSAPGLRPSSWRRRRYAESTSIETSLPRLFLGHFESSTQGSLP